MENILSGANAFNAEQVIPEYNRYVGIFLSDVNAKFIVGQVMHNKLFSECERSLSFV